jgi:TolB-like protein
MTSEAVVRRLAAIVAADVVGYSRLTGEDEAGTLTRLKSRRKEIVEPAVARHRGRIFKVTGDGVLIEFDSAVNAVACALEMQRAMAAAEAGEPDSRRIVLRIGVHAGDVIVEGGDRYGEGVNIAARLEGIAEPGGIAVSAAVFDQVANKVAAAFDDLGHQALKNISAPVRVFRVAMAASHTTPSAGGRLAVAVLPFANLGGDPSQDYFSDGITEDIITELSRWRGFAVLSRSATFRYRGPAADIARIARELDARYIVEGSVRRAGERIRITAQLIDAESGAHVWAERFDRDFAEVFAVQDEVVRRIVGTVAGRLQVADARRARRKPPASMAAYEYVLQGNALPWNSPAGFAEAVHCFERAIAVDPGYGLAYALLAIMRFREWRSDLTGSAAKLQEAHDLARRALELASEECTVYLVLGDVCLFRRAYDLAAQHARRAIELNANNQWAIADQGANLINLGRAEEALDWLKRAREIDPYFDPAWYWEELGLAQMMLRRYEEALAAFEHPADVRFWTRAYMAGCHAKLGAMDRAAAAAAQCLAAKPDFTIGRWLAKEPFKNPADAAHLADCLRLAGLPE